MQDSNDFSPLPEDMLSALNKLNKERDEVWGLSEQTQSNIQEEDIVKHLKQKGVHYVMRLTSRILRDLGYDIRNGRQIVHRGSGKTINY